MIGKPNEKLMKSQYQKTLALKIMSLDMNTATATNYSRKRGQKGPNMAVVGKGM